MKDQLISIIILGHITQRIEYSPIINADQNFLESLGSALVGSLLLFAYKLLY